MREIVSACYRKQNKRPSEKRKRERKRKWRKKLRLFSCKSISLNGFHYVLSKFSFNWNVMEVEWTKNRMLQSSERKATKFTVFKYEFAHSVPWESLLIWSYYEADIVPNLLKNQNKNKKMKCPTTLLNFLRFFFMLCSGELKSGNSCEWFCRWLFNWQWNLFGAIIIVGTIEITTMNDSHCHTGGTSLWSSFEYN